MGLGHPRKEPRRSGRARPRIRIPTDRGGSAWRAGRTRSQSPRSARPRARRAPRSTTACRCRAARRARAGRDRLREPGAQRPAAAPPRYAAKRGVGRRARLTRRVRCAHRAARSIVTDGPRPASGIEAPKRRESVDQELDDGTVGKATRDELGKRLGLGAQHVDDGLLAGSEIEAPERRFGVEAQRPVAETREQIAHALGSDAAADHAPDGRKRRHVRGGPSGTFEKIRLLVVAVGGGVRQAREKLESSARPARAAASRAPPRRERHARRALARASDLPRSRRPRPRPRPPHRELPARGRARPRARRDSGRAPAPAPRPRSRPRASPGSAPRTRSFPSGDDRARK